MSYLALYRKHRPQTFDEIVGQDHITTTLINQIQNGKVGHAYLFCGSRGTGKTTCARIFARAINCENPKNGSACGKCAICKAMEESQNCDIVEIDAASNNGVDDARDLREKVKFLPLVGKKKVFIIDEVHMLSTSAFNALLKTLEEPPEHIVFIFGTTETQKLPSTILSRMMRFDFHLVSVDNLMKILESVLHKEKMDYDKDALSIIARAAEGSVRDALSILDSCVSFSDNKLTRDSVVEVLGTVNFEEISEIADGVLSADYAKVFVSLDKLIGKGKSPLVLSKDLISYFRDLLVVKTVKNDAKNLISCTTEDFKVLFEKSQNANFDQVILAIEKLGEVESELRLSVHPRIVLETAIIKIITSGNTELLEKVGKITAKPMPEPCDKKCENVIIARKNDLVLGELLQYLRESGEMSTLALCQDIDEISTSSVDANIVLSNEDSFGELKKEKPFAKLKKFFDVKNLKINLLCTPKNRKEVNIEKIKNMVGNKFSEE